MDENLETEEPVVFDTSHYKNGLNGDFVEPSDGLDLIAKFAGAKGGGGKFEDIEKRDIAAGASAIISMLQQYVKIPRNGTILDVGAGTGLLMTRLASVVPEGKLMEADISSDFCTWIRARIEAENVANVQVVQVTARDPCPGITDELNLALMCDVYHHLEFPKTVCRTIKKRLHRIDGRLVIIDFFRDPVSVF
jgi:ubiquinone/menaquinone biosynthesis C-methylase UbiE